ncbi:MFS transporter [Nocardia sp. NPDC059091]|uniref:MFS transporter n=1 Tax=unclassified Nocardia TaxID=2637762 RepID=UPI00367A35AF
MITPISADGNDAPAVPARAAWGAFAACLIAVFLQMLDLTVVNTALPALARDLGAPGLAQLLVVTGYSLAFACTLPAAARLGDIHGRRMLFLVSMAGFAAASLWCGGADQAVALIAGRIVQGVAAAGMAAQTVAIVNAGFEPDRRVLAFGIYGAVAGLAGLAGPLMGGAVVAADPFGLGWHAIFLLNAPAGLAAFALAYRHLHIGAAADPGRVDVSGVLLASTGLLLVLYPATVGRERGWPPYLLGLLAAGCVVLAAFGWQQRRAAGTGLLRTSIFADRAFAVGSILLLVCYGIFTAFLFAVSVAAQTGLGMTALQTAKLMAPFALGAVPAAVTAPILMVRMGSRTLTVGIVLFGLSLAMIATSLDPARASIDTRMLSGPVFLAGAGMGWFATPLPALMTARVTAEETGSASGLLPTIQQLGSAIGAAALGTLFFSRVSSGTGVPQGKAVLAQALAQQGLSPEQTAASVEGFGDCVRSALASAAPAMDLTTCAATDPIVAVSAIPVLWWQCEHGWPQLAMGTVVDAEQRAATGGVAGLPIQFAVLAGVIGVPLALTGFWALTTAPDSRPYRFVAIAAGIDIVFILAADGRTAGDLIVFVDSDLVAPSPDQLAGSFLT